MSEKIFFQTRRTFFRQTRAISESSHVNSQLSIFIQLRGMKIFYSGVKKFCPHPFSKGVLSLLASH